MISFNNIFVGWSILEKFLKILTSSLNKILFQLGVYVDLNSNFYDVVLFNEGEILIAFSFEKSQKTKNKKRKNKSKSKLGIKNKNSPTYK